ADEDRRRSLEALAGEGAVKLERERLVGAGKRGHVEEIADAVGPIEHDHAALLGEEPLDRIGKDGEGTADATGVFQEIVAEQLAEPVPDADRPRLERDGAEIDQSVL